jgi:hypothetical protein
MLILTGVIVAAVVGVLLTILLYLIRISSSLAAVNDQIGQLPGMLAPVDGVVGRLAGALTKLRRLLDPTFNG